MNMVSLKPKNKVPLKKVDSGEYITPDRKYLVFKGLKGWSWQVSDGVKWVAKDTRVYRTRDRCLMNIEKDREIEQDETELWEG